MSYPADVRERLAAESAEIIARYPRPRSALLPMLHLVQAEDGYVSPDGIVFCAETLNLQAAEVSAVATFYTQYKRRPNGTYTVGICTNTLCAVMGGDEIFDAVSDHLGVGHDETTDDGAITLEKIECNAACDYAPVVMVNWEFFDNQTPTAATALCDDLRAGAPVTPTRGAARVCSFRETSRVLAGFSDGRADEGVGSGEASLVGLRLARENDWTAPAPAQRTDRSSPDDAQGPTQPAPTQPSAGQPSTGQPSAGQPSAGQPSAGQPSAGQPSAGQPSTGQPGSSAQHQSGTGAAATGSSSGGAGPSAPAADGEGQRKNGDKEGGR